MTHAFPSAPSLDYRLEARLSDAASVAKGKRGTYPASLWFLSAVWVIVLFEPQWWLVSKGLLFLRQLPTVLIGILVVMTIVRGPRDWFRPLLGMVGYWAASLPLAYVTSASIPPTKILIIYYLLAVGTLTFVRTPRQVLPILGLACIYQ